METTQAGNDKALELSIACEKLEALGEVIILVSNHNPMSFEDIGDSLGRIIVDYVREVSDEIQDAYFALNDFYEGEASTQLDNESEDSDVNRATSGKQFKAA